MQVSTFIKENGNNLKLSVQVDRYTKLVLSVIAVCLMLIALNMYIKPGTLHAVETVQDVNIKSINGSSLSGSEIPVNLKQVSGRSVNGEIPVDITSIKGSDLWNNEIPVDVKSVNGNFIFGSDLPVRVR